MNDDNNIIVNRSYCNRVLRNARNSALKRRAAISINVACPPTRQFRAECRFIRIFEKRRKRRLHPKLGVQISVKTIIATGIRKTYSSGSSSVALGVPRPRRRYIIILHDAEERFRGLPNTVGNLRNRFKWRRNCRVTYLGRIAVSGTTGYWPRGMMVQRVVGMQINRTEISRSRRTRQVVNVDSNRRRTVFGFLLRGARLNNNNKKHTHELG